MNPAEMNISLNELSHHGILGMKWGVRRYQPYPAGYSGDGKYIGPKPGRNVTDKDTARINKLNKRIGSTVNEAVASGDTKTVKKLKGVVSNNDYNEIKAAAVASGIKRAIDTGDIKSLKKYKKDVPKSTYETAMNKTRFVSAVNSLSSKKMNKYATKLSNDEIKEIISKITTLSDMNRKMSSIRHDSSKLSDIAAITKDVGAIVGVALASKKLLSTVSDNKGAAKSIKDMIDSGFMAKD